MSNVKQKLPKMRIEGLVTRTAVEGYDEDVIEVTVSTGETCLRTEPKIKGIEGPYYEKLQVDESSVILTRLNSSAPFLVEHTPSVWTVIGRAFKGWIEDGSVKALIRLTKNPDKKNIVDEVKSGILANVSGGYVRKRAVNITQPGDQYPTILITLWEIMEVSSVAINFDSGAITNRSAADSEFYEIEIITRSGEEMETETPSTTESTQTSEATTTETQVTTETSVNEETQATPPHIEETQNSSAELGTQDTAEVKRVAVEEYKQQCETIKRSAAAAGLDVSVADDLITRGFSTEQASIEIFKLLESKQGDKNLNLVKEQKMDNKQFVIEALVHRAYPKAQISEENLLKGKSFLEIIAHVLPREAKESNEQFAKRAIASTDIQNILLNASNKLVNNIAASKGLVYDKFTAPLTLRDFKEAPIVWLSEYELSEPNAETGDYPQGTLVDSKEKIKLRQRGILLTLTLVAMVNDDLELLKKLPSFASKSGFRDLEKAVFGIINTNPVMSDTKNLFHADHKNLLNDVTGVDVESMALAEVALAEQTGLAGIELDLKPKVILVSPKYALAARRLVGAQTSSDPAKFNPYAGSDIEVVVSNKLTNKDAWYVFADPEVMPAIVTGTLEGMDSPQVSSEDVFSSSSWRMKVEFHNNAAAVNYQAVVKLVIDTTP